MAFAFLDSTARSAWNSATSQQAQLEALDALFTAPTLRYYASNGTHLDTVTHAVGSIATGTDPRTWSPGAVSARTNVTTGTATYIIAATAPSGGTDILRADIAPMTIVTGSRPNLQPQTGGAGLVVTAVASLPLVDAPAWRSGLAIGQWVEVTTSNDLADVNPALSTTYNRTFPSNHWASFQSIVTAWNGACYDQAGETLWLPLQGGHNDYSGNEVYKIVCAADSPTWVMVRAPSDSLTLTDITLDDGQESTGLYSDGRLRPGHSYNHNIFIPGVGPVVTQVAGAYSSGAGGKRLLSVIDESTGEATLSVDWSAATQAGAPYGFAAWDSSRSRVFACGVETARPYTIVLGGAATARGTNANIMAGYARGCYCASLDVVVCMSSTSAGAYNAADGWTVFDPDTGADFHPAITGSFASGFSISGLVGMEWDNINGRLLLWNNSSNTAQISTLTPGADTYTSDWTAGSIAISGSNTVTPSAAAVSGSGNTTLGRLAFSPAMGGCFLLNSVNGPLYFVRTH